MLDKDWITKSVILEHKSLMSCRWYVVSVEKMLEFVLNMETAPRCNDIAPRF